MVRTLATAVLLAATVLLPAARGDSVIYHALPQRGNVAFSPLGVEIFLKGTAACARGDALQQVQRALRAEGAAPDLDYGRLVRTISARNPNAAFNVAGAFFVDKKAHLQNSVAQNYLSQVEEVDYLHNADEAKRDLVQWINRNTHGCIANADPPISAKTRLAILGSTYFKGRFATPFVPYRKPYHFRNVDGSRSHVSMMQQRLTVPCGQVKALGNANVVAIPYVDDNIDLYVLLPGQKNDIDVLEKRMRSIRVPSIYTQLKRQSVNVMLPRFIIASRHNLKQPFIQSGMRDIFNPGALALMDSPSTLWQEIHEGYFAAYEQGTEAAASTESAFVADSGVQNALYDDYTVPAPAVLDADSHPFTADYPFLYYVVDRLSGETLYQGRVTHL